MKNNRMIYQGKGLLHKLLMDNAKYMKSRKNARKKTYSAENDAVISQLYRYAEPWDIVLMTVGSLAALINGVALPLTSFLFGDLTAAFVSQSKYANDPRYHMDNVPEGHVFSMYKSSAKITGTISANSSSSDFISEQTFLGITNAFGIYYVYIGLFVFVFTFIQIACWEIACCNQVFKLRQVFFAQTMRQDIGWYDERENEDLTNKIIDDMERMRDGLGSKVPVLFQAISLLFCGLAVGFSTSWKLTLVIMIGGPILLISSGITASVAAGVAQREQLRYGIAGGIASEVLTSMNTVSAYGGEKFEIDRFSKAIEEGRKLTLKKYYVLSGGMALSMGLIYVLYGVGLWYGSNLYLEHEIKPGQIFTVFMSVVSGALGIGNSLPNIIEISTAVGAASTIFEIIDNVPKVDPYSKEGRVIEAMKGDIEFRNSYFSYPMRPQVMVLSGLHLKIPAGKVVAIVGSSGAGKSTLVSLILRFYDPICGKVLVDDIDITELNVQNYRSKIGVVSQEPVLFDVSIEENIRYGKPDATKSEIEEAAKVAFAHSFIESLPKGYETLVGERGVQLSGGQKQRIAIARAIVRKPKILLLDEATSALDARSEMIVQAALENASKGRTTLIIAHRLSTVKNADVIYAMKDGRVAECGTHDELMEKKGIYYNLVLAQSKKTSETEETDKVQIVLEKPKSMRKKSFKRFSIKRLSTKITRQKQEKPEEEEEVSYFSLLRITDSQVMIACSLIFVTIAGFHIPVFSILYGGILGLFSLPEYQFTRAVTMWSIYFFILAFFTAFSMSCAVLTSSILTENMIKELRIKTFKNIISQQISFFNEENYSPIKLTNTLAKDPPLIKNVAGMRAGFIIITTVTTVLSMAIAFYCGWRIALIVICFVPIIVFGNWVEMRLRFKSYQQDVATTARVAKIASECLQNIKTVQFLGLQEHMLSVFMNELYKSHRDERKQGLIFALTFGAVSATVFFMYGCTFKFGSEFVNSGYMTGDDIYRTVFALVFASTTLGTSALFFQDFGKAKVAVTKVYRLMIKPTTLNIFTEEGEKPDIQGNVEFQDLHFSYPTRKHVQVLNGLNLKISKGKSVALVGGSGCGKSTIISLLERFYNPKKGAILIDGVNIEKINVNYLRSQIGLVTQEPTLFDTSIRDNICYGMSNFNKEVTEQQIIDAAKAANIHEFICNLPEGYETKVGERGSKLSGGQKQRIAIARALLRNPKILLLDEATSALDTESEKVVQDALDKAREGRTSIIIAHRLSTIKSADMIAVIADGRVNELGTHDELIERKGLYYDLVKNQ